jgi:hypothetical protein
MLRSLRLYALVGLLLVSCGPDNLPQAATKTSAKKYELGAIMVQLPETWKALDYNASGLVDAHKGPAYRQRHLFVNTVAPDTTLRETIVLTIDKREGTFHAEKAGQELAKNLRALPTQLQVLTLQDTLLHNGNLAIIEVTSRNLDLHLDIIQTYAFYTRAHMLVSFMGTARSRSKTANQQTRAFFRQAITSITWK